MSKPEFVYVTYIETTPEKLFQALTDSDFSKRYWFNTSFRTDWRIGSPFALVMDGKVTDTGTVLEYDPPKRLAYTFRNETDEAAAKEKPSRVTFVLQPYGKLVKLTLTHDDFVPGSVNLDGISKGWPAILSSLKSLLEKGEPLAIPFAAMEIDPSVLNR
jgi:uncharacterized protein YndB with AHSA1/START domain